MRAIFIAALVASGISLLGSSPSRAVPMSGNAIGQASELGRVTTGARGIMGMTTGPDGRLYYADGLSNTVVRVDP